MRRTNIAVLAENRSAVSIGSSGWLCIGACSRVTHIGSSRADAVSSEQVSATVFEFISVPSISTGASFALSSKMGMEGVLIRRCTRGYRRMASGAHNSGAAAGARQARTAAAGSPPGRALQPVATCTRGQPQRQIHTRWAPRRSRPSSGTPSSGQTALPSHRPKARTIRRQRAGKRAHPTDSEHGAAGPPRMVSELRHTMAAHLRAAPADATTLSGNSSPHPSPKTTQWSTSAGAESTPRAPTTAPSPTALRPRPPLSGRPRRPQLRPDDAERAYYARARASGVCTWAAHHRRASVHTAGSPAGSGSNTDGSARCSVN